MRMRKKKHLKERLEKVSEFIIDIKKDIPNVKEAVKNKAYIHVEDLFGEGKSVNIEMGCGKGGFIRDLALLNPDRAYFAVEMIENIMLLAVETVKKAEVKNVRFINVGAEYIERYFKDESVDEIYLNFSPPYPPKGYEGRRLTNPARIESYRKILKKGGTVYQKTDDADFFEYSRQNFLDAGFNVTDLSDSPEEDLPLPIKIKSEYENKFIDKGISIKKLKAEK